jgi:dTDP-4-dehydrorhamnose reductase
MAHKILLIGGHGKVSQLLTPLLLARSWNVTSMIRSADQKPTIEKLGQGQPGKLDVLVSSVEDVKGESDAQKILEQVKPDWVVWSAGMLHYLRSGISPDSGHCHGSSLMNALFICSYR